MKIEKIYYEQLFPTGQYANQRLGIEISVDPVDYEAHDFNEYNVTKEAFEFAKRYVNDSFKSINPAAHFEEAPTQSAPPPTIDRRKEEVKEMIAEATTISELERQFNEALRYNLRKEYEEKKQQLNSALAKQQNL